MSKNRLKKFRPNFSLSPIRDKKQFIDPTPKEEFNELSEFCQLFSPGSIRYEDVKEVKIIGQGEFGTVYKCAHVSEPKRVFARKRLKLGIKATAQQKKAVDMELRLLRNISHPNIIKLESFYFREGNVDILLEFMDCGSLGDILPIVKKFPEPAISQATKQILTGLVYLHEKKRIIHRDIKPQNILVNSKGICKLCDFGMGNTCAEEEQESIFFSQQGDMMYMSLERIRGKSHMFNCDVWSVGMVMLECALGRFPYCSGLGGNIFALRDAIMEFPPVAVLEKGGSFSRPFVDFLAQACKLDKLERPSAEELLGHEFIKMYEGHSPSFRSFVHEKYIAERKRRAKKKKERKKEKSKTIES